MDFKSSEHHCDISDSNKNEKCIIWVYVLIHTYEKLFYKVKLWDI